VADAGGTVPVIVVGLSDGGAGSLSPATLALIREATVLAGGRRQLGFFADHKARRIEIGAAAGESVAAIRDAMDKGERVVVLASGDPLLFGIGHTLVSALGTGQVRVLPGPSSVQLAFAAIGEPWHEAVVLSAHGRPIEELLPAALSGRTVAILTDSQSTPGVIAARLRDAGMEDCRAVVCERLGGTRQRVVESSLWQLPEERFDPLNVLLLLRDQTAARLTFGLPDDRFESVRGQITKAEVRAVTLSKLRLAPDGVLWDVGAGSGALAVEAARLMPRGHVFAIERDPEQLACIERNCKRHGAGNVTIVAGQAPEALAGLPAPSSVFLGGSGGRLAELLDAIDPPLVANLALLEHLGLLLDRHPTAEVVQLNVARAKAMDGGRRLSALNPVWIAVVPAAVDSAMNR